LNYYHHQHHHHQQQHAPHSSWNPSSRNVRPTLGKPHSDTCHLDSWDDEDPGNDMKDASGIQDIDGNLLKLAHCDSEDYESLLESSSWNDPSVGI
jgi:hypothetical protein